MPTGWHLVYFFVTSVPECSCVSNGCGLYRLEIYLVEREHEEIGRKMTDLERDIQGADNESTELMRGKVSIPVIVLNWNGVYDTIECVDALLASDGVDFRVVLVDNDSSADDFEHLRARYESHEKIELRRNAQNLGFARGVNAVLQEVLACPRNRPEFVSLLNNDAVPEPGWLAALVTKAESSGAGAVASKMIRHDNRDRLDNAGHVFLNTGEILPRGAGQSPDDYIKPASVAGVCGGACLLRSSMLDDIGMFDEFFSTGYEDAELGLRALLAGYEQIFAPKAVVRHRIGASIDKIRDLSYAVQLQVNINYTYVKLVPWPVAVWNLPWILLKTVALLILPLLMGRWRLLKVQWRAFGRTMRFLPTMFRARRRFKKRRVSSSVVIGRQKFFARLYAGYFRRFVIGGKPTIFER